MLQSFSKGLLKTVGRLSKGVQLSFDQGFTSGELMEYIYEDKPRGSGFIGRWIDRMYTKNEGWEAVRIRKQHTVSMLLDIIKKHRIDHNKPCVVLDVAAGSAAYIMDAAKKMPQGFSDFICLDTSESCVEMIRKKASSSGLKNIQSFQANSFKDLPSYSTYKPDVIISVGFFEWLPEDAQIIKVLKEISAILAVGGKLIASVQTNHENIALVNS